MILLVLHLKYNALLVSVPKMSRSLFFYFCMMPNENSQKQILDKYPQHRKRVTFKSLFVIASSALPSALSIYIKNLQQNAFFFAWVNFLKSLTFLKKFIKQSPAKTNSEITFEIHWAKIRTKLLHKLKNLAKRKN